MVLFLLARLVGIRRIGIVLDPNNRSRERSLKRAILFVVDVVILLQILSYMESLLIPW